MYIKQNTVQKFLLVLTFCMVAFSAKAQNFDYKSRPKLDFKFNRAKINLQINPQNLSIKGAVQYKLTANISGTDTLTLDDPGISIDSVRSQNERLNYYSNGDSLQIALGKPSQIGQHYQVTIAYHATPHFGLLKSSEGTIWTSMLPRSTRHWLPTKDNPRVMMNVTLSLRVPEDYKVFATGVSKNKQMYPDSTKKLTYVTGSRIPITTLAFGLGHFHGINSFAEAHCISDSVQHKLVNDTKKILARIKKATGMGYPYQRVNLVILKDDHWEQKSYGASTIFLYKNRGNWLSQLRRGLYAQWFGVYLHEAQWGDSRPVKFMQTVLHYQLTDSTAMMNAKNDGPHTGFSTVYDNFSPKNWNFWQHYPSWNIPNTKKIAAEVMPRLLKQGPGTLTSEKLDNMWYKISGQPKIKGLPAFDSTATKGNTAKSDTVLYAVTFKLNQSSDSLQLAFQAKKDTLQQKVNLPVQIMTNTGTQKKQVLFKGGAVDTVWVSLPAGTKNVNIQAPAYQRMALEQYKPVPYSLYQLRNAKTTAARVEAARQLGMHTNDTDLQLALTNAMKKNNNPKVQAALLKAYGAITKGANGTQHYFLNALNSSSAKVQSVALTALQNYKGQSVTQKLKSIAGNHADTSLANRALRMYMQRVDSTTALNFTNTLIQQDTSGTRAITAIGVLADRGDTSDAVKYAKFYIEPVYDYPVRAQALKILMNHDTSAQDWQKQLKMLLSDPDPRIRYLTVINIHKIKGVQADSVLSSFKAYDARVYKAAKGK